jgi:regulator of sirC expression with transglutaminase-like and TPR domain
VFLSIPAAPVVPEPEKIRVQARFAESPEFRRLVSGGENLRLERIALEIARDAYPALDMAAYLNKIELLEERIRHRSRTVAKPREIVGHINWVLYVEEGMRGNQDDYYDPRNSYLNEVLDRRLGIPISLSVLYWALAERLRVPAAGVNLPMHFMLRVDAEGEFFFIDPFHGGAILDRTACAQRLSEISGQAVALTDSAVAACSMPVVVTRMLRNLKGIYWKAQDLASALPVQRRLAALNSHDPSELRDLAVLCTKLDHPGEAIDAFNAYLREVPHADDANEIKEMLGVLEHRVARWN